MEEVLETYTRPKDPRFPVVWMDEQPVQLVQEAREPVAATTEHAQRVDDEYWRMGTGSVFLFTELLAGCRAATAQPCRTKTDWAEEVAALLNGRYRHCERLTLVCDNVHPHTKGAFS